MTARKRKTRPTEMNKQQREIYDRITQGARARESAFPLTDDEGALSGPFDAMLLAPAIGNALQSLGSAIRFEGALTNRAREIAILLVAHHFHSAFEVFAHEAVARRLGMSVEELDDLARNRQLSDADPYEATVVELVNRLLREQDLDEDSYDSAVRELGEATVFEVNTIVGYYSLLAIQLRIFRV